MRGDSSHWHSGAPTATSSAINTEHRCNGCRSRLRVGQALRQGSSTHSAYYGLCRPQARLRWHHERNGGTDALLPNCHCHLNLHRLIGRLCLTAASGSADGCQCWCHRGNRHFHRRCGRNRYRFPMGKWNADISGSPVLVQSGWVICGRCGRDTDDWDRDGAKPAQCCRLQR